MNPPLIPIFITEEDAKKFVLFQKYYDLFAKMEQKGFFDLQYGKCTINVVANVPQNFVIEEMYRLNLTN